MVAQRVRGCAAQLQDAKAPQQHSADDDKGCDEQRNVVALVVTVAPGRVETHLLLQELVEVVVVDEFFDVDVTVGQNPHMF